MATMLENYQAQKINFDNGMQTAMPDLAQIWRQQELLYRIEVLETCQMFVKTAPNSVDLDMLVPHYQMIDAYIQSLTLERRYGLNTSNEEIKKLRNTAYNSLNLVIESYRKHFESFTPENDTGCYRKIITSVIQTVLPVWIQYRQTYIDIKKHSCNEYSGQISSTGQNQFHKRCGGFRSNTAGR